MFENDRPWQFVLAALFGLSLILAAICLFKPGAWIDGRFYKQVRTEADGRLENFFHGYVEKSGDRYTYRVGMETGEFSLEDEDFSPYRSQLLSAARMLESGETGRFLTVSRWLVLLLIGAVIFALGAVFTLRCDVLSNFLYRETMLTGETELSGFGWACGRIGGLMIAAVGAFFMSGLAQFILVKV